MEIKILRNKRCEHPMDFSMKFPCDFCNDYVSQVAVISFGIPICKSCLQEVIDKLDKNMRDNFQKDFDEERAYYDAGIC